jgi:hypothetical protein
MKKAPPREVIWQRDQGPEAGRHDGAAAPTATQGQANLQAIVDAGRVTRR